MPATKAGRGLSVAVGERRRLRLGPLGPYGLAFLRFGLGEIGGVGAILGRVLGDRKRRAAIGCLGDMLLDEAGHDPVASGASRAAEHDRNDVPPAAPDRRQQVEARSTGIAGLDSVHSGDAIEQMVVIVHRAAGEAEFMRRKIGVIAREALLDRPAEHGKIMRRGELLVVRQAGGIRIMGAGHAEGMRLLGHHSRRTCLHRRRALRRQRRRCRWPIG